MHKSFHQKLRAIGDGTAFLNKKSNQEFLRQNLDIMEERLQMQSYFLRENSKTAIHAEIVKNTVHSLYAMKEMLSGMGRLEQHGKQVLHEGKFNIKLECENGSNLAQDNPLFKIRDLMRMEVFKRHDGTFVVYGRKSLESIWSKLRSRDKTMMSPEYADPPLVLAEIGALRQKLTGRVDLSPSERDARRADLAAIESILSGTVRAKEKRDVAEDSARRQAGKIVKEIEECVELAKKAYSDDGKAVLKELDETLKCPFPYQSNRAWPLSKAEADAIFSSINDHGGRNAGEALEKFVASYSEELDRNTVPAPLQLQLSEFLRLTKIAVLYTIAKVSAAPGAPDKTDETLDRMRTRLATINGCIDEISLSAADLEKLNLKFDSGLFSAAGGKAEAFAALLEMGEKRQAIHAGLEKLKNEIAMLCTKKKESMDGRDEFDRLAVLIPITMAYNFTRVSKAEAALWKSFISSFRPALMGSLGAQDCRNLERRINRFIAQAEAEKPSAKKAPERGLKTVVREQEVRILKLMERLEKFDPGMSAALYEIFNDTKSHMLYKLGGLQILCKSLAFHLTAERLVLEADSKAGKESMPSGALLGMVDANRRLFGLFDKYNMSEPVLELLDRFNHFEPNAFDSNSDYKKLVEAASQGSIFEIKYEHFVEQADGGEKITLTMNSRNFGHEIALPAGKFEFSHDEFDERTIDEILYGSKQPLPDYLKSLDGSLDISAPLTAKRAYETIAGAYLGSLGNFLHVRSMMADPGTHEFLASFALKQRIINGVMFIPKNGEIAYNDPSRLDGVNNLLEGAGFSPSEIEYYKGQVGWYLKLSPARIMLHSLHSRKWRWALKCAHRIAELPSFSANPLSNGFKPTPSNSINVF